MSRTLKIAGTITLLLLLAVSAMAAANAQTYPQPTNVTADKHHRWSRAGQLGRRQRLPIHRVGWTHDADF